MNLGRHTITIADLTDGELRTIAAHYTATGDMDRLARVTAELDMRAAGVLDAIIHDPRRVTV
jgi:hypothetical protein